MAALLLVALFGCSSGPPETATEDADTSQMDSGPQDAAEADGAEPTDAGGQPSDAGPAEDAADVDGGGAPPCRHDDSCASHVCRLGICRAPTCYDGAQNGDERGVDCGGSCSPCLAPDAPPLSDDLAESTRFLYEGPSAVQRGVAPGTIQPRRAAVLFGTVTARDGSPLVDVEVTVLGHTELGRTRTRAGGRYDIVVNGGGTVTLSFAIPGHLPAQRTVTTPWRDFQAVEDVVLVELDPAVTTIDFSAPIQVARGSPMVDDAGARQATVLFRQGTTATMELPGGQTAALPVLSVRATEYTVGPTGPSAMPGKLPVTSGYTYAVELGADEAIASGATRIRFDRPVGVYVDNFLGFQVGSVVPVGYYDHARAAWVPSDNGLVVRILSVDGGRASLDLRGSGEPAQPSDLQAAGITDAELVTLATLYTSGTTLWHFSVTHFTPWDCNWPYGPPEDVDVPDPTFDEDEVDDCPCDEAGSVVDCQNAALGESIPLDGTPFALAYRSDRLPGRLARDGAAIKVTGASISPSLLSSIVELSVGGRTFRQERPAIPNQVMAFAWDGLNAYGRPLSGKVRASVRIGQVYRAQYYPPSAFIPGISGVARAFGALARARAPAADVSRDTARSEVTLWSTRSTWVHGPDHRSLAMGGWSLDALHYYDANAQTLYQGDGTTRQAAALSRVVRPLSPRFDGVPSARSNLRLFTIGPDGAIYATPYAPVLWKRSPDGQVTTLAGSGLTGHSGDGGPAALAQIGLVTALALGPDESLYFTSRIGARGTPGFSYLRRIRPDGIIETIAGQQTQGLEGDGGPAVDAHLGEVWALAVSPDGSIYLGDGRPLAGTSEGDPGPRIRRISPDGVIETFAGGKDSRSSRPAEENGRPAADARFGLIRHLLVEPDGSLLVTADGAVRRITPDGIIHSVAWGGGFTGPVSVGVPAVSATQTNLRAMAVARDADGRLFIQSLAGGLLLVDTDGFLTQIGGAGDLVAGGTAGVPLGRMAFDSISAVTFGGPQIGPDGNLYFLVDPGSGGAVDVEMAELSLPGFSGQEAVVPSASGQELFVFEPHGRHLRTLDTLTGTLKLSFGYDANGRLLTATDGTGNVTRLERSPAGDLTAIVAPGGQRTSFQMGSDGYLATSTDSAGRTTTLTYSPGGLLTSLATPGGGTHHYAYDSFGRLTRDEGPDGYWQSLTRSTTDRATTVIRTTSGGLETTFVTEKLPDGTIRRTKTDPGARVTTFEEHLDLTTRRVEPDGTIFSDRRAPDPLLGLSVSYVDRETITTPRGLAYVLERTRTVTPAGATSPAQVEAIEETIARAGGPVSRLTYRRADGTLTSVSPGGRRQVTHLDVLGRPALIEGAGVAPTVLGYGSSGLLESMTRGAGADARTTAWTYDEARRPTSISGPDGRVTGLAYADASHRLARLDLPGARAVLYDYDADGDRVSTTPPGSAAHRFAFSSRRQLASYTPPLVGSDADTVSYEYGANREPTAIRLPDGRSAGYGYDTAGRFTHVTLARGLVRTRYAASGLVASIEAPDESLTFEYDGSLPTRTIFGGTVEGEVALSYDAQLRPLTETVSGGAPITLTYDADSLPVGAGALTITRSPAGGLVTATALGTVTTAHAYDAFGDLTDRSARAGSSPLASWHYTWDPSGRLSSVTESLAGEPQVVRDYERDAAGRLTAVRRNGAVEETYTYDDNGNRTGISRGGPSEQATYDAQDRLIGQGEVTYTFSRSGHLSGRTRPGETETFSYDEQGSLTDVTLGGTAIHYVVDGQDRRVAKIVNGSLVQGFLYRGLAPVAELDARGVVVSRFVYGVSGTVPDYLVKDGVTYRMLTDHVGSVRLVVDEAGGVVQRLEYSPWGEVVSDSNPGFQPFGFAGGLYDRDTRLVHFWARDYDPAAGRWTARDPLAFDGGSTNLYAYVRDDPVSTRDPEGLSPEDVRKIFAAARDRTSEMTREGQRMDPGWLNNMKSALPMLDGALGCHLGICDQGYSGCREQSQTVMDELEARMKDGRLRTDAKWTVEQKFAPVHFWLEATSSDPSDPVLVLDPWRNTFQVKPSN